MRTPKAVITYCSEFEESPEDLRDYVRRQREFFNGLPQTNGDFEQWLAFKMSCTRRDAQSIIRWADADQEAR
jgi:hypothetical protein